MSKFKNSFASLMEEGCNYTVEQTVLETMYKPRRFIQRNDVMYYEGGQIVISAQFNNNPDTRNNVMREANGVYVDLPDKLCRAYMLPDGTPIKKSWLTDTNPFLWDTEFNIVLPTIRPYLGHILYPHDGASPYLSVRDKRMEATTGYITVVVPDYKRVARIMKSEAFNVYWLTCVAEVKLNDKGAPKRNLPFSKDTEFDFCNELCNQLEQGGGEHTDLPTVVHDVGKCTTKQLLRAYLVSLSEEKQQHPYLRSADGKYVNQPVKEK